MRRVVLASCLTSTLMSAAVTLLVLHWWLPRTEGSASVIRAERFEVIDPQGVVKVRLGGPARNDSLTLMDNNGVERATLRALADETVMLALADGSGTYRAIFYVNRDGYSALRLTDPRGGAADLSSSP